MRRPPSLISRMVFVNVELSGITVSVLSHDWIELVSDPLGISRYSRSGEVSRSDPANPTKPVCSTTERKYTELHKCFSSVYRQSRFGFYAACSALVALVEHQACELQQSRQISARIGLEEG